MMQERQAAGVAETSAASWFLLHDDRQFGPLSDRELLLLAERGGLKADDLLWRSGFDEWKPVSAVCGTTAATLPASDTAPVQVAGALPREATSVDEGKQGKRSLKARLYEELQKFLVMFAYLWLVFFVFLVHEWTVLASHNIGFRFYGLALVNALVLSKIMLIAEGLKFADGLNGKPLIYPIVFKSVAFSVLLMFCYIAEEVAVGMFHGKGLAEAFPQIGGGGWAGVVTIGAIMCIALMPFFAFKEIGRSIGEAEFRALMLGPGRKVERERLQPGALLTPAE
jgi:hypothetical protein